jgi:hypothetical protein
VSVGDLDEAERLIAMLSEYSAKHPMTLGDLLARCLNGALLLAQGNLFGVALLRVALESLRETMFGFDYGAFLGTLARGLANAGQTAEARAAINESLERCVRTEERWCLPELLRTKGDLLWVDRSVTAIEAAEDCYLQALDWACRQEALSWERCSAMSLAELWHGRGNCAQADHSSLRSTTCSLRDFNLKAVRTLIGEHRMSPLILPEARSSSMAARPDRRSVRPHTTNSAEAEIAREPRQGRPRSPTAAPLRMQHGSITLQFA